MVRIDLGVVDVSDLLKLMGMVVLGGELDFWNVGYVFCLGDSFMVL